ncbi:hypothetical protein Tco_1450730 [Tanacetum coccineum]
MCGNVKKDIDEIKTINIELEHNQFDSIKQTCVRSKEHSDSLIAQINAKSVEILDLNAQLQEKVFAIRALKNELRKVKGKIVVDTAVSKSHATTIALGMFKLNLEPLAPILVKNKDPHIDYIKHSRDHAKTLLGIVENARALSPLDSNLDSALVVTPINKDKKVRFADPLTSSSNTQKTQDSNKPLLHSTGVKCSTSTSGLKPSDNTKNNRISHASSSNKINKVEDQSRSIKSRKNKKNHVNKPECNTGVMQSMLNANSVSEPISNALVKHSASNAKIESLCAIYNKCLFDANHTMCLIDHLNYMNVRNKAKSNRNKKRKKWKPTGKVFTTIGYSWKPTGRNFTINGNRCPLTRITSTKIVPPKESTIAPVVTPTQEILVYRRRPKASRSVGSNSKVVQIVLWYLNSGCSKHMTRNRSQLINFGSRFLGTVRFRNDHIAKIMGMKIIKWETS